MPASAAPLPAPPPLVAPAGFRLAVPSEVVTGPALVGRKVLFYWPTGGWVRGTVARRSCAAGHSHVVRYARATRRSALGAIVADSLLDAASHGQGMQWAAQGAALHCVLALAHRFSRPTVTAFWVGQASRPGKRKNYYNGEHARDCDLDRA